MLFILLIALILTNKRALLLIPALIYGFIYLIIKEKNKVLKSLKFIIPSIAFDPFNEFFDCCIIHQILLVKKNCNYNHFDNSTNSSFEYSLYLPSANIVFVVSGSFFNNFFKSISLGNSIIFPSLSSSL